MMLLDADMEASLWGFLRTPAQPKRCWKWFTSDAISVKVALNTRRLNGRAFQTVEVADVTVEDDYQREGLYARLLDVLENNQLGRACYIDMDVANGGYGIGHFYRARGYLLMPQEEEWQTSSYIKLWRNND